MSINKKFNLLLTTLLLILVVNVNAQELSKQEKKSLKKELKNYLKDPIKFKYLKESLATKEVIVNEQAKELSTLGKERNEIKYALNAARDSIGIYENQLLSYKNASANVAECVNDDGMKYRVQIGLYRQFDIRSFLQELKVTSFEEVDGMFRYTIGNFTTEEEAELFKEAIRKMGIAGAFVAYYLDGERIPK